MPPRKKKTPDPTFSEDAQTRKNELVTGFDDCLVGVAFKFAKVEAAETLLVRHFDEAYAALGRVGMRRVKFWHRPEAEGIVGGILTGLSFTAPRAIESLASANVYKQYHLGAIAFTLFMSIGLIATIHSALRKQA